MLSKSNWNQSSLVLLVLVPKNPFRIHLTQHIVKKFKILFQGGFDFCSFKKLYKFSGSSRIGLPIVYMQAKLVLRLWLSSHLLDRYAGCWLLIYLKQLKTMISWGVFFDGQNSFNQWFWAFFLSFGLFANLKKL